MPTETIRSLPEMPQPAGSIGSDAFASAVGQSATGGRARRHAARADRRPDQIAGETLTLVSTDRYRLAVRELRWTPARPDLAAAVLVPAGRGGHRAGPHGRAEVFHRTRAAGEDGGAGEGMIGFEGGGRRTTTRASAATSPVTSRCFPAGECGGRTSARRSPRRSRRVAWSPSGNTAVRLSFSARPARAGGPGRVTRRRPRKSSTQLRRRRHPDRLQPAVPAGRADRPGLRHRPDLVHRVRQARTDHRKPRPTSSRLPVAAYAIRLGQLSGPVVPMCTDPPRAH